MSQGSGAFGQYNVKAGRLRAELLDAVIGAVNFDNVG